MDKSVFEMNVWIDGCRGEEWSGQEFAMSERMRIRLTAPREGRMRVLCTLTLRQYHPCTTTPRLSHAIRDWFSRLDNLFMILRSSSKKMPEYCIKLDRFLPDPFQLIIYCPCFNRYSDGLRARRQVRFPSRARDCSLCHSVQTDSGPTQPHIQWAQGGFPLG
jgi:hypothetical protein